MEFIKVKEVACCVMKKIRPGSLGDPVLNGALSITLNILKHVLSPPNMTGALHIGHGLTATIQALAQTYTTRTLTEKDIGKTCLDSGKDDDIQELKDRLAAYNLDSSSDQLSGACQEQRTKRAAAKKPPSTDDEEMQTIPEEKDESNVEFALKFVVNAKGVKKGGRKPAANVKPSVATKKR
ncbi:hypothetical protein GIB67_033901 [Kingdonia uniflora]|uniref:Uncharacterized protein n=1 Tax=Kingdonia uniflora TaxID=39325 RepID=A0A7J7NC02_9MAGN|nr:hypothetical protein GIB67_033901 [Kingdonia uniflora]